MNIGRLEIAKMISKKLEIPKDISMDMIEVFTEIVKRTLLNVNGVTLYGLGTFTPKVHAERMARDPQKNVPFLIPARAVPYFTPSRIFKQQMIDTLKVVKRDDGIIKKNKNINYTIVGSLEN